MSNVEQLSFNPKDLLDLYQRQAYDELSAQLLKILLHFEATTYFQVDVQTQYFIDTFVKHFLYLFTQPDYIVADRHAVQFVELNLTISNLVAMSSFKTTDAFLDILAVQPSNFAKLLTLYSARNVRTFDYKMLFDANPQLACLWYSYFLEAYRSALVDPVAAQNMRAHLKYEDERITEFYNISDVYFGATYIDPNLDKGIKRRINASLRNGPFGQGAVIQNKPQRKQIAVITALWFRGHSVHRTLNHYVEALADDYDLTLVHLGPLRDGIHVGPYDSIRYVLLEPNGRLNIDSVRQNEFSLVFYPDVGMTMESILLSNLRLAPIQICGTGHPVSTFGSEIDYFLSGAQVDLADQAEEHYSERLVLLPGFGCIHDYPTYQIRGAQKQTSRLVINCPWYAQKVNAELVGLMRKIRDRSEKEIVFRVFVGGGLDRKNDFLPFARQVEAALGRDNVQIVAGKPYEEYMAHLEEGDMCLECFPFGGSNILADCLYLRKPVVAYQGDHWYSRIGSAMMRAAGLSELIATDGEQYCTLALKLIHDDAYRQGVQERLQNTDLASTVFGSQEKQHFRKAIDFLLANHERLRHNEKKTPIVID